MATTLTGTVALVAGASSGIGAAARPQAEAAVQQAVDRFGQLDTLVRQRRPRPVAGADTDEWDRMIAVNVQGLLYTRTAMPHLLRAAKQGTRRVAEVQAVQAVQHQLDRRRRRLERLRRLQPHQVRRERIHRVPARPGRGRRRP